MDKLSREFEEQHLNKVLRVIKKACDEKREKVKEKDDEIDEMNKRYSDENFELYVQLVVNTDLSKQLHRQIRSYERALNATYFGRVDFQPEGEKKQRIYIGRGAVSENNELLVIDWRTPIANLYYEGENGPASYIAPDGEISGKLSLKRTFNITKGQLQDYYDADVITNDELLQEYLAKNTDVVLRDIVATIQADQNEIIRVEDWRNVIVQGVAGSGKTTVALHRLSWLIFNAGRGEDHYLIIGTNRMFLNYVSGMLPDLGVESIRQMMMRELLLYVLYYSSEKCTVVPDEAWKSTPEYAECLEKFMDRYQRDLFCRDIVFEDEVFFSKEDAEESLRLVPLLPMRERAENFRMLISFRLNLQRKKVFDKIESRYDEMFAAAETREEKNRIYDSKYDYLKRANSRYPGMQGTFVNKLRGVTEKSIYIEFLNELAAAAGDDKTRVKSLKANISRVKKNAFDLYDLASMMFISAQLDSNDRVSEFDHIVIDEAQDFGAMIYRCLTRAFHKSKFTVLGDLAQNISGGAGLGSWNEIEKYFPNLYFHALTKSYRNTIEIADFANRVLDHIVTGYEITPVVRHGRAVEFRQAKDTDECAEFAAYAVMNSARRGNAAIICRDEDEARYVYEKIGEKLGARLMADDSIMYEGGTVITTVKLIKGLEFDTVVVFNAGSGVYNETAADAKLLYVALTRALHELSIFYVGAPARVLAEETERR